MGKVRSGAAADGREEQGVGVAALWGMVVALLATGVGALLFAVGLLVTENLEPTAGALLAISLVGVALGSLWASRRVGHSGLWLGGGIGLGYGLLACVLAGVLRLGPLTLSGVLQGVLSGVLVGAAAGIIGVNL
ncbi:MAG TPA: TIGR04086 family membrane protein [Firmicutes bacterium]|nr:TIGR04086 family membrane protein [Bacillota bacterium]